MMCREKVCVKDLTYHTKYSIIKTWKPMTVATYIRTYEIKVLSLEPR